MDNREIVAKALDIIQKSLSDNKHLSVRHIHVWNDNFHVAAFGGKTIAYDTPFEAATAILSKKQWTCTGVYV